MATTLERVLQVVRDQFGELDHKVEPDVRLREDLEADSLDIVELVMALEDEFGIETEDEEWEDAKTVRDFVAIVEKQR